MRPCMLHAARRELAMFWGMIYHHSAGPDFNFTILRLISIHHTRLTDLDAVPVGKLLRHPLLMRRTAMRRMQDMGRQTVLGTGEKAGNK